nr:hypothetical protein Iba_chr11fCG0080 [Ipomoea batatas]
MELKFAQWNLHVHEGYCAAGGEQSRFWLERRRCTLTRRLKLAAGDDGELQMKNEAKDDAAAAGHMHIHTHAHGLDHGAAALS